MDIVEQIRSDRENGARRLESEYKAGLLTLARRLCVDESDAEELVNRTFAIMAVMLAFAMVGRYAFFEKILSFFVALMALAFLASVFATWPEPDVLARAAHPLLPGSGASLLMLAAFVGTTMAAPTFVTRPLIIREKGLAADDLGKERIDSTVSASLMFVISGSIVLVATGALFAREATISSVLDMAETLRPLAGRLAVAIFLCGTLAAGLSSVFPILMVAPLLVGDWRSGRMETRSATFRILCIVASAWGLVVPALGKNPVAVTIAAQVSNVFVLPLAVAAVLWLLNRRDVMGKHRAGPCLTMSSKEDCGGRLTTMCRQPSLSSLAGKPLRRRDGELQV